MNTMIIEISIIVVLASIFFIYIRKWPEPNQSQDPETEKKKAEEQLKKHIEKISQPPSEDPEVNDLIEKANTYFNEEEWKKAEKLYLKAAAKDPKCGKAYSRLGVIYLKTGKDYEDAEEAFKQALKLDPKNGYIYNNLGLVYHNQEKYDLAIDFFEKSIRADFNQASRHANLGIVYFAKRQYAKAEKSLKRAVSLDPDNHEYQDLLKESTEKRKTHRSLIK